jgi:hypothetical protein
MALTTLNAIASRAIPPLASLLNAPKNTTLPSLACGGRGVILLSSSVSAWLTDYSQVDMPGSRLTWVNFGAGQGPGSERLRQS